MLGKAYLLFDDDDPNAKPHLHIVICEPDETGHVVLVSVTTRRAKSDTMVCLSPGDHPFLTAPSVVTFAYSKILTVSRLEQMIRSGDATPKPDASKELLRRLQDGMVETTRAPEEVVELFKWQQSRGRT